MTNFKIIRLISKGAFAHVYEVLEMRSGLTLAVKIVSYAQFHLLQQKYDNMFETEVRIMKKLFKHRVQGMHVPY